MRSQRQLRVGEEIRHTIAAILMRGDIPWPHGFNAPHITVTEVQVSPDLKNATAFVMPLGGVMVNESVKYLNNIMGYFRHAVAKEINLRYVPKIRFAADTSFEYAERIEKILLDPVVQKDLRNDSKNDDEVEDL